MADTTVVNKLLYGDPTGAKVDLEALLNSKRDQVLSVAKTELTKELMKGHCTSAGDYKGAK